MLNTAYIHVALEWLDSISGKWEDVLYNIEATVCMYVFMYVCISLLIDYLNL